MPINDKQNIATSTVASSRGTFEMSQTVILSNAMTTSQFDSKRTRRHRSLLTFHCEDTDRRNALSEERLQKVSLLHNQSPQWRPLRVVSDHYVIKEERSVQHVINILHKQRSTSSYSCVYLDVFDEDVERIDWPRLHLRPIAFVIL